MSSVGIILTCIFFEGFGIRFDAAYYGEGQVGCAQFDGELCARVRSKRVIAVAGKDHQADLLPCADDLIVGLKIEGQFLELSGSKRLALADGSPVLWVRPAPRDYVFGDLYILAVFPGE